MLENRNTRRREQTRRRTNHIQVIVSLRSFRCVVVFAFVVYKVYCSRINHVQETTRPCGSSDVSSHISIVVLCQNREKHLEKLLLSLQNTHFCRDSIKLTLNFDLGANQTDTIELAERFSFRHGKYAIRYPTESWGLANAWYNAWDPTLPNERAIILEDDITLSPFWYIWLKQAWNSYDSRTDLAGISLQRQSLIPYTNNHKFKSKEIVNGHLPFLYPLVGSIGFSPHPQIWREFLRWVRADANQARDVFIPGIITSDWWESQNDRRNMWTQHFVYFCLQRELFTLYINLPTGVTLASHSRAIGVHSKVDRGRDFPIMERAKYRFRFPDTLYRYTWNGTPEQRYIFNQRDRDMPTSLILSTLLRAAKAMTKSNGFVYLMFLNANFLEMTKSWICNVEIVDSDVLPFTIFVTSDTSTLRELWDFRPGLRAFTISTRQEEVLFGTYQYYNLVLQRILLQNFLIESHISIQIVEPDHVWLQPLSGTLREAFSHHEVVAGDEAAFTGQSDPKLCGGFYGINATLKMRDFFDRYTDEYAHYVDGFRKYEGRTGRIPRFVDDQVLLTQRLIERSISIHWLSSCQYANGLWYNSRQFKSACPNPSLVHNNFIIGSVGKAGRALHNNHWFLQANGSCITR